MSMPARIFYMVVGLLTNTACFTQQPRLVLPVGHSAQIQAVQFSPCGKWVVTGSFDNTAKVWDSYTGKLIFDLNGQHGNVVSVMYSADSKKILTLHFGPQTSAVLWSAVTGERLLTIHDDGYDKTRTALISHDNRFIITTSISSKAIRKYDISTGSLIQQWESHHSYIQSTSTQDNYFFTYGGDSIVRKWNIEDGKFLEEWRYTPEEYTGHQLLVSPDSNYYALLNRDEFQLIISNKKGETVIVPARIGLVSQVYFSSDSKMIATVSPENITRTWELRSGRKVSEMKGHTFAGSIPTFSDDNSRLAIASGDNGIRIWDLLYGQMTHKLIGHTGKINSIDISAGGNSLVSASSDSTAITWDITSGRLIHKLKGHSDKVNKAVFSPDGKSILTASADTTAVLWNAATARSIHKLEGHAGPVLDAGFTLEGRKVVTASRDGSISIWDAVTGTRIHYMAEHRANVNGIAFSNDGKTMASVSSDNTAMTWDIQSGKRIAHINSNPYTLDMRRAQFSPDGNVLLTNALNGMDLSDPFTGRLLPGVGDEGNSGVFTKDGKKVITRINNHATIWSSDSLKKLAILRGHKSGIVAHTVSPDCKWVVTIAQDNSAKLWDVNTGKLLCSFYAIDETDFIVESPDGYYLSSPGAAKQLHYVTKDLQTLSFDQLDVRNNRPDKVLEAIGNTDTSLIRSYRRAWEKRIRRLGIDTTAFRDGTSIPRADFYNRATISYEYDFEKLLLRIVGFDSMFLLDRFNVWVNEVPVFGRQGINLREKQSNNLDTIITVRLSGGENRIETSITNVNGTESFRKPLFVHHTAEESTNTVVHFIGIGIDEFADSNYNLRYSTKDIRDLGRALKDRYRDHLVMDTLFNQYVSASSVRTLKEKLMKTSVDDVVIISYSGHGLLNRDFDYFLSTYAVNFEKPEENGLPYEELENLLDSIPARRKLLLIDACHSGEVDKDELVRLDSAPDSLIKGLKPVAHKKEGQLGMKNSFELMQNLFVNVGKSTGATVISAAAGTQFALERNDLENGVFTFSILEILGKESKISISELRKRVGERVMSLTGGRQVPTSRNEMLVADWEL